MISIEDTLIGLLEQDKKERYLALLNSVADAYYRMSTSVDEQYVELQKSKCNTWLYEMTSIIMSLNNK